MSQTKAQLVGGVGFSTADSLTVHNGLAVTGVVTATSFDGNITGNITGNATGLTGTPGIEVGIITASSISAVSADFSGNVTIGGTLQYEDVTNIDAIGIVTARSGINITGAGMTVTGIGTFRDSVNLLSGASVTGVVTATSFVGDITGDVTGTASNASGATGDFSIADKIVHTGDTNTALRFPAADTFTVETGGTERLRVTSDGIVDVTGKLRIDISSTGTVGSGSAEGIFLRNTNETDNNAVTIFGGADDYSAAASAINFVNVDHSANAGAISFDTRTTGNSYAERLRITSAGNVSIQNDSGKFTVGAGDDLEIYHDGSHSFIDDSGTGGLYIRAANTLGFRDAANSFAQFANFNSGGSTELMHNGAKKFETKSDGIDVTGEVQCDSLDVDGDANFEGANYDAQWDKSQNRFRISDNGKLTLGSDNDFDIYHTGSHAKVINSTGRIDIETGTGNIDLLGKDGTEAMAKFIPDGAVELYHNNSKKLETTSSGVTVTGAVTDSIGTLRRPGVNEQTVAYTLVAADSGKTVVQNTNSTAITVPNSVFTQGDLVTILNNTGTNINITQGSGLTMYNTADAATGTRTLAQRGVATVLFFSSSRAYISGAGLS